MSSVWSEGVERPRFKALDGDASTDVLIIGGGIAGLLTAYMLTGAGVDCILVEAGQIAGGITENTTAKITLQHGLIYDRLIKARGVYNARLYLDAAQRALSFYGELCEKIDCDFERCDSYVFSLRDREKIEREIHALNKLGVTAEESGGGELPFEVAGAVRVKNQARFNPLKFLYAISHGLPIYENTKVLGLSPSGALTDRGKISSKKTVVATHFPFLNKHGAYFLKMHQHRSYVIALRGAEKISGMYVDECDTGLSFRPYRDLLLLGGGAHRTGKGGGGWGELLGVASRYYPRASVVGKWATQDCMTLDGVPYIGRYSPRTPSLFVATGFNKWGMTSSVAAAMLLTDLVRGKKNKYEELFSPSRSPLYPALAANIAASLTGLLTPGGPRCPHLGCKLKYNREEHSWDCPCHGSRFRETGELIDNPATDDKKEIGRG
ncbi:MAG: FAD-dependent oxidoreductase [Clostridia bacterium]|nr:FAD-dependent oxidoreductase [Clostridia bacterium]